ncbi:MAG: phage minor capsid protein [Desulfuromonadaceae bacterium]|nr:phage minor capsid protein [Desulfuromonadaceae bacterium]
MNQGALEQVPLGVEQAFGNLQTRIMEDVVRRIRINGFVTRSADWEITRLRQLGESDAYIKKQIQIALHLSDAAIDDIYLDAVGKEYTRNAELYRLTGSTLPALADNIELQDLISSVKSQTKDTLNNITRSMGFVTQEGGKLKALDLTTFYQKTLDAALGDISSGAFDYSTALRRTIKDMTNSGLRWIDYESGYHNRVTVAARRATITGFNQTISHMNEKTARDLGTDSFEVTWHAGARPEHQAWQGQVYTKQQLIEICGLGSGDGLKGWNCYHDYLPFVPGASVRSYSDDQLRAMNAAENTPKTYNGKEYTTYEALQRQRQLETNMRAQRQEIDLLKKGGADEKDIINANARYRVTSAEYTGLSKTMGLPQQRERVTIDGMGKRSSNNVIAPRAEKSINTALLIDNDHIGKTYGKALSMQYRTISGDEYVLTGTDIGNVGILPKNTSETDFFVYAAPKSSGFLKGKYVLDDNLNAIFTDGRVVLNNYSANNETRNAIRAMLEDEISSLAGIRGDNIWYRAANNPKELDYLKKGIIRPSVNHMTKAVEDGLSVWERPLYHADNIYKISGDLIGIGADGEPLLDVKTVKLLSDKPFTLDLQDELMKKGKALFLNKYNWTPEQLDNALKGKWTKKTDLQVN